MRGNRGERKGGVNTRERGREMGKEMQENKRARKYKGREIGEGKNMEDGT